MNLRFNYLLLVVVACAWGASADKPKVSNSKDVAAILNQHCVECHRAGEVAPMVFTQVEELGCTGSWSMRVFQMLSAGKTVQLPTLGACAAAQLANPSNIANGIRCFIRNTPPRPSEYGLEEV